MRVFTLLALSLALGHAQALELTRVQGTAEMSSGQRSAGGWKPASPGPVEGGVRTRLGRVVLGEGTGRLTLGPHTSLELRQGEPALLSGQLYLEGPLVGFVGSAHFRLEAGSRARVDVVGPLSRFAVLSGRASLYSTLVRKTQALGGNQSLNLRTQQVKTHVEEPRPWYQEQVSGLGAIQLEAFRGTVEVQNAGTWAALLRGQGLSGEGAIRTGPQSWAELGFEGGGYLRLGEKALLRVLGLEQLEGGKRKVILALEQGSAWNVVEKGKGGYELRTATLVAGVRGTVFRLDADGLLKVLEGQVSAASQSGEQPVGQGQQVSDGQKGALTLDALDRFNLERDRLRSAPLRLEGGLPPAGTVQAVTLGLTTNPDSEVVLTLDGRSVSLTPDAAGRVRYAPTLPEGEVTLGLTVSHYADSRTQTVRYTVDRSAPRIEGVDLRREGKDSVLRLTVPEPGSLTLTLRDAEGREVPYTGSLEAGALRVAWFDGLLELELRDGAGNRTVQRFDLSLPH